MPKLGNGAHCCQRRRRGVTIAMVVSSSCRRLGWSSPGVGCGVVSGTQLIQVRVGDVEIEVEAVLVAGTQPTSGGRAAKAAESVRDAFSRAQETIIEVARSTAQMIDRTGTAARPDRVEVEFGLKFTVSGGVIMAGVAGEASLAVTLGYDVASRSAAAEPPAPALGGGSP